MNLSEIQQLMQVFAALGTKKIRITGGEPSLRNDLTRVIQSAAALDGIEKVALTTNGFRLDKMAQQWRDAGLDSVNVSIDSFDEKQFELITGYSQLNKILKGVELACKLGLQVKLNLVLMREFNASIIHSVLNYIKDMPVTFRFIELMQTGDNLRFFDRQHVNTNDIEQVLLTAGFVLSNTEKFGGPAKVFEHPNYQGKVGIISPYSKGFCDTCNRLRVSALGKLHLCLFAEHGNDLRWGMDPNLVFDDLSMLNEPLQPKQKQLIAHIRGQMGNKKLSHYLHEGNTGATTHLAMLGG